MDRFKDIFADSEDDKKAAGKKKGISAKEKRRLENESQAGFWEKFRQCLYHAFDWMTATGSASPTANSVFYRDGNERFKGFNERIITSRGKLDSYLLSFPY